ncbi:MAG TPA: RecQ family ATP-dependent DNA helicase [Chloroflexi bacterium]|nr:RecQ family ATP-dependent DNA helicase [Chloroflexota bacterium]
MWMIHNLGNAMAEVNALITSQLHLPPESISSLPQEVRDALLLYLQRYGEPAEQLKVAETLRVSHGGWPALLDYLAHAYLASGNPQQAMEIIERRQRRNTTIGSHALEARAFLSLGMRDAAQRIALELVAANPRNGLAIAAAAQVLAQTTDYETAAAPVIAYLASKPYDLQGTLTLALVAAETGHPDLADAQLQRLGGGIPAGITVEQLTLLHQVAEMLDKRETAAAAALELQRRQQQELRSLQAALAPFVDGADLLLSDPGAFYRQYTGLDSVVLTREERQRVQIETIRHFGFDRLREGQLETIALALLRNESVLTVMPTGGGKSLCYQLPALVLPRATLVISPLIALMKDQVEGLPKAAQAQAVFINSTLSDAELAARMEGVARGDYKLIYAAPERLRQRTFLHALRRAGLDLFVVDEAHCVSMWGHDFRPDYLFIQQARAALGNPPALAMTATAPPRVRDEIVDYISDVTGDVAGGQRRRPHVIALDIFRPNLHLSALQFHNEDEKLAALVNYVGKTAGSGIVYVNTRSRAETIAGALRHAGIAAEAYHAGLADRSPVQDRFMANQTRVVVATIAFGMGIDKADIRFIVHFHPSRSLDAYYQEVGRAGRDGRLSQGVLFYSNNDWANLRRWARADEFALDFLKRVYAAIAAQLGVAVNASNQAATAENSASPPEAEAEAPTATVTPVAPGRITAPDAEGAAGPVELRRLQQVLSSDETTVRVAISMLERAGLLQRGFDLPREVTITVPRRLNRTALEERTVARLFKGLQLGPDQSATFALADIARFMRWPLAEAEERLLELGGEGVFTLRFGRRAMFIELPPEPDDLEARLEALLAQSVAVAQRRIDDMIGYATTDSCRHGYISAHFGSPPRTHCDVCDNCTGVRPDIVQPARVEHLLPDDADIEPMIIDCLISLPKPVGRSGLARILTGALRAPVGPDQARHFGALKALGEGGVIAYIDDLLEQNRLRQYTRQDYLVLAPTLRGRTEAEAWLSEHPDLAAYGAAPPETEGLTEAETESDRYTALQKALWLWRRRLAEELAQPAYVVMRNELMLRIAEVRPQTLEELAALPGMGAQRLQHYGAAVLDIIKLNPPQPGDDARLAAQRAEQEAQAAAKATSSQETEQISPQLERQIYMRLQEMRQKLAIASRVKPFTIAGDPLLKEIARRAPTSLDALQAVPGFAASELNKTSAQIITLIVALRQQG